jgi:hypothetical protein
MKNKIFIGIISLAIVAVAAFNVNMNLNLNAPFGSSLSLKQLDALAQWAGGWNPGENGSGTGQFGYNFVAERVEIWVGGRVTITYKDVCKPTIELVFRCTF